MSITKTLTKKQTKMRRRPRNTTTSPPSTVVAENTVVAVATEVATTTTARSSRSLASTAPVVTATGAKGEATVVVDRGQLPTRMRMASSWRRATRSHAVRDVVATVATVAAEAVTIGARAEARERVADAVMAAVVTGAAKPSQTRPIRALVPLR